MGGDDVLGMVIAGALILIGLFLLPGFIWLIWQCLCGIVHFIIGCFDFFGKLMDMYLGAFPALLVFIFPAFLICFARGGK